MHVYYICGNYRNRARKDFVCTTHYIRKSVMQELVLTDLRRVMSYVKENEQDFIQTATEYGDRKAKKDLEISQKELFKVQSRITELDTIFRELYEDNALGRLSDERFVLMISGYDDEKKALTKKVKVLEQEINTSTQRKSDIDKFLKMVSKYSDIQELTYKNVHEFIDRILIYEWDRETDTRNPFFRH